MLLNKSHSLLLLLSLTLLLALPGQAIIRPLPPYVGLPTQDSLTRLFFNSRVTRRDPGTSVACFASYIGESNLINERYGSLYSDCLRAVNAARVKIGEEFLAIRLKIHRTSERVCEALTACNRVNGTLDSFNCHASVGSNNTIATYTISGNASESATLLQERFRVIDLQHEQCIQKAERTYVESTAGNYKYLQACLDGRTKPKPLPKTTTTSSTTTTTTTTTTEAPTSTPADLTTDATINIEDQFKQLLNLLN